MDTFGLKIISSDRVFYEGRCRKMIVPVPDGGGMEILPHHEDMVIAVVHIFPVRQCFSLKKANG